MITSKDLQQCQKTLENIAKSEIDSPMTDMRKLKRLLTVIDEVDSLRRETWNDEKFGDSQELADNMLEICSDDIPF